MAFNFKEVDFNTTKVSTQIVDPATPGFLWIGFEKNNNNVCKLFKVSAHNLKQTYYNIDVSVDKIVRFTILSSQIFLAVNHNSFMGFRYNRNTPLTTNSSIDRPSSIVENPIDLTFNSFFIYYLFPGTTSGEFAKIAKINQSGVLQEILVLNKSGETINNASRIISEGTNLWVATTDNPARLVRIFNLSGPMDYEVTILN